MQPTVVGGGPLKGGALWSSIERACRRAESSGALKHISTRPRLLTVPQPPPGGAATFVLRVAENLKDKPKGPPAGKPAVPFVDPFEKTAL